jgi:hypothetical protein
MSSGPESTLMPRSSRLAHPHCRATASPTGSAVRAVLAATRGIRNPPRAHRRSERGRQVVAGRRGPRGPGPAPARCLVRPRRRLSGWSGLERASAQLARSARATPTPRRDRQLASLGLGRATDRASRAVRPGTALIIEGCGRSAAGGASPGAVRVWIDAPDAVRKRRRAGSRRRCVRPVLGTSGSVSGAATCTAVARAASPVAASAPRPTDASSPSRSRRGSCARPEPEG